MRLQKEVGISHRLRQREATPAWELALATNWKAPRDQAGGSSPPLSCSHFQCPLLSGVCFGPLSLHRQASPHSLHMALSVAPKCHPRSQRSHLTSARHLLIQPPDSSFPGASLTFQSSAGVVCRAVLGEGTLVGGAPQVSAKHVWYCSPVLRSLIFPQSSRIALSCFKGLWFVFLNMIFETVVKTELLGLSEN